jgi:hypothetical protein
MKPTEASRQIVRNFIAHYTAAHKPQLAFEWNGKEGPELHDLRSLFRNQLLDAIVTDGTPAPIELVRERGI